MYLCMYVCIYTNDTEYSPTEAKNIKMNKHFLGEEIKIDRKYFYKKDQNENIYLLEKIKTNSFPSIYIERDIV